MSTQTTENINAIAELVLDGAAMAQDAVLSVISPLADALKPVAEKLQELPFADIVPDPAEAAGAAFDFAEKVLASQKEFASKLFAAYGPDKA